MKKILTISLIWFLIMNLCISIVFPIKSDDIEYYKIESKSIISFNSGPDELWNLTFGTERFDAFFGVEETQDGGYIAFGTTDGINYYNGGDFFLVKTNSDGEVEWENSYGGSKTDFGSAIKKTKDGGYIMLGSTSSFGSGQWDIWILKVNENGIEEWNTTFGGANFEQSGQSIVETDDNCYIVTGLTYSFSGDFSHDALLLKLDENGNELWNITYGTNNNEHFWDVEICSDGSYILTGFSKNSTINNAWVVKTDSNGIIIWEKLFGPANQGIDIVESDYGDYVFVSEAENSCFGGYLNSWLIKIDNNGELIWDKLFISPIGKNNFAVHHHILKHNEEGFILTGTTNGVKPVYSVGDLWLTRVDEYGNVIWSKIIGGSEYDSTYRFDYKDGEYIIAGATKSYGLGNFDAWLVKIKDFENLRPIKPDTPNGPSKGKIDTEYTFSTSSSDPDGDSIQFLWDWGDGNFSELLDSPEATYNWTTDNEFEVKVIAIDEHGGESDWSDPLTVIMPRSKSLEYNTWLLRLIQRFPILEYLL